MLDIASKPNSCSCNSTFSANDSYLDQSLHAAARCASIFSLLVIEVSFRLCAKIADSLLANGWLDFCIAGLADCMSRLACLRWLTPRPEIRSRSKASSSAFLFQASMRYNAVFLIGSLSILKSSNALPTLILSLSGPKSKPANIPGNKIFSGHSYNPSAKLFYTTSL